VERSEMEEIMRLVDLSVVVCVCLSVYTNWRRYAPWRAPSSYLRAIVMYHE